MEDKYPIKSSLQIVLITILVSAFVLTFLNYFNIIPLSSALPFLSFLPNKVSQENQKHLRTPSQKTSNSKVFELASARNNIVFKNTTGKWSVKPIEGSFIQPNNQLLKIDTSLSITSNSSESSGIIFLTKTGDQKAARARITYDRIKEEWVLGYQNAESKINKTLLKSPKSQKNTHEFSFYITPDGKTIAAKNPDNYTVKIDLPESFYSQNQIFTVVLTAPDSEVAFSKLVYTLSN